MKSAISQSGRAQKNAGISWDDHIPIMEERLKTFVQSWPSSLSGEFLEYSSGLTSAEFRKNPKNSWVGLYPFWIYLPVWLTEKYSGKKTATSKQFLRDILWVQICLFFFIRIQDDLYDGHTKYQSLIFASNLFLLEAESVLSDYFSTSSRFWKIYREALKNSSKAIVETVHLQQRPRTAPAKLIKAYAGIAAHFDIVIAAICIRYRRMADLSCLTQFSVQMVIAGQLMDDLEDLEDDLKYGKYNYVANRLLREITGKLTPQSKVEEEIRRAILVTDGVGKLFNAVRKHLHLAAKAIKPLDLPEAITLLHDYREGVNKIAFIIHQQRVNFFFK